LKIIVNNGAAPASIILLLACYNW